MQFTYRPTDRQTDTEREFLWRLPPTGDDRAIASNCAVCYWHGRQQCLQMQVATMDWRLLRRRRWTRINEEKQKNPSRPPAHYAHGMLVGDHEEQPKPGLDTGQQQNDQQTGYDERRGDILQRIRRRLITIEYIFQFLGPLNGSLCWGKAREGIGIKRKRIKSSWKE